MHFTNRRWLAGSVLWLLCCLSTAAIAERGLLYELSREGEAPSYLLGTMHTDDPRVLATVSHIAASFERTDRLVLEMVLDADAMMASSSGMLLPAGESLSALLGEVDFRRLQSVAADYGLTDAVLQRMKPWAVAVTLSLPPPATGQFLDRQLYQRALQQDKAIYGLESVQ